MASCSRCDTLCVVMQIAQQALVRKFGKGYDSTGEEIM